jgi:signal transduction histidine kinase
MTKPLRGMAAAAKSFSTGDFTVRVPAEGEDEIAQLARSFNHMADSMADLESVRRSFIANVSHELKTPMMTIGGFIDGILDGTVPEEKHKQYLEIVSEEIKRLSRLVKSMLSIARIEAGDMKMNPTDFDVNELVCRTVFAFEQKIEEKQLEIMGLESDEVFVNADNGISVCKFLAVYSCGVFSASNGFALYLERRISGTIFLPCRRGHKKIFFTDAALSWIMPVM